MNADGLLWMTLALPAACAAACLALRDPGTVLTFVRLAGAAAAAYLGLVACVVFKTGVLSGAGDWLVLDALSAFHALVLSWVFGASSVYAGSYFGAELREGSLNARDIRRFGALWFGAMASMTATLVCGNLGLMWVSMEATTLLTAFLICIHVRPLSLEAMWKYLIVCSVGVAFAFMGTLLVGSAAQRLSLGSMDMLLWSRLRPAAAGLDPATMKLAFIFILVGYGTKAGLAPMHSWLPDAHSQAPAPVSALFSGFMLSAGMYCILRFIPLTEAALGGAGWSLRLLAGMGTLSILVAAVFIAFQQDAKRLLAFSSVEHIGVIALGFGLGGVGTFAALWHTLNHAAAKTLAFHSAGALGQGRGTNSLKAFAGSLRAASPWGQGLFWGLLVLIGVAPFAVFMSELMVLKAAADAGAYWTLALFLLGTGIIFVGVLRHAVDAAWGEPPAMPSAARPEPHPEVPGVTQRLLVWAPLALLLLLGVWLPDWLGTAIARAAQVVGGAR